MPNNRDVRIGRARLFVAGMVAGTLLVAGCSGASGSDAASDDGGSRTTGSAPAQTTTPTTPPAELFTGEDFYAVPDPLPAGDHGLLLRYQTVEPTVVDGATTYRVMYLSESVAGEPIAVTGTALVPDAAAPSGGRRQLTIAHGTTGIADECAPSKEPGSELALMGDVIEDGWLVAMTDYEGLGTPGRHPYLVGVSEGRSTLDAIVAAAQLPGADAGDQLAIAGYSQGGHGALWANEIAARWTPSLDVVGTFAGAPATEMEVILQGAPAGFKFLMIAGYAAAYPEALPSTFLTPQAEQRLGAVDEGCSGEVFRAVSDLPADAVTRTNAFEEGPWVELADENDPGNASTDDPILVIHSDADDVVPVVLSQFLLERMCQVDQVVERRILTDGAGHGAAAPPAYGQGLEWLAARFGTDPPEPVNSCPG